MLLPEVRPNLLAVHLWHRIVSVFRSRLLVKHNVAKVGLGLLLSSSSSLLRPRSRSPFWHGSSMATAHGNASASPAM